MALLAVERCDRAAVCCPGCGMDGDRGTAITAVLGWRWAPEGGGLWFFGIKPLFFSCFASSVSASLHAELQDWGVPEVLGCWSSAWG